MRKKRPPTVSSAMIAVTLSAALSSGAYHAAAAEHSHPDGSVSAFTISKSENANAVVYSVLVDDACAPRGNAPIFAYWRMRERGGDVTEPLLERELPAYGVAAQRVLAREESRGTVEVKLRALESRPIVVETMRGVGGACHAVATVVVAGAPAHIFDVHVQIRWPFGIDHLLLSAWSLDGSHVVTERVRD
jgi:hypothetical protein